MAGRGGGFRGRGSGRGFSGSFKNRTASGSEAMDIPLPKIQAPPLYPSLENPCLPLAEDDNFEELVVFKNNLLANFRAQDTYLAPRDPLWKKVAQPCDSYGPVRKRVTELYWELLPMELWPEQEQKEAHAKLIDLKNKKDAEQQEIKKKEKEEKQKAATNASYSLDDLFRKYEGKDDESAEKEEKDKEETKIIEEVNDVPDIEDMEVNEDEELDEGTDYYQQFNDDDDNDDDFAFSSAGKDDEGPVF